jgi:RNA recognition motif-containing protein
MKGRNMNIYVGGLSPDTTEDELREAFVTFGEVATVKIVRDGATGESRGFGFVTMTGDQEAKEAIKEMNGKELKGSELKVEPGRTRGVSPGFSGKGPGGGRPRMGGRPGGRPGGGRPGGPGGRSGGPGGRSGGPSRGPGGPSRGNRY